MATLLYLFVRVCRRLEGGYKYRVGVCRDRLGRIIKSQGLVLGHVFKTLIIIQLVGHTS